MMKLVLSFNAGHDEVLRMTRVYIPNDEGRLADFLGACLPASCMPGSCTFPLLSRFNSRNLMKI